jgi:hypothetical protein
MHLLNDISISLPPWMMDHIKSTSFLIFFLIQFKINKNQLVKFFAFKVGKGKNIPYSTKSRHEADARQWSKDRMGQFSPLRRVATARTDLF